MKELFLNILANFLFWVGLGFIVHLSIYKTRISFLRFFNLEADRKLLVYLSNLWLPSMERKPWGRILSGQEFRAVETITNLFGSTPFNFPEIVKGLVDSFWIGKRINVHIDTSPLTESVNLSSNMIVVGASIKNNIRKYLINKNMVFIKIVGEPTDLPEDNDILTNSLEQRFIIMKGKRKDEFLERNENYNLAVIEKLCITEDNSVVFMCTGQRGDSSWAATEYLARHWRELYRKYRTKEFARCLWFTFLNEPMQEYKEPVHIIDVSS